MTLKRKNAIIRKVKDITIGGTLSLLLLGGSAFLQSCDDGEEHEIAYTKSIQTYIQEIEPNKFQIVHEDVGDENQESKAYISYINGTTKVLTIEEAQKMMAQEKPDTLAHIAQNQTDTTSTPYTSSLSDKTYNNNPSYRLNQGDNSTGANTSTRQGDYTTHDHYQYHNGGSNLSTLLYYSALGNMLGRHHSYQAPTHFYHSPDSYAKSYQTNSSIRNSMTTRPRSTSSGFFGSSRARSSS
jgi:hypothetical protein